MRFLLVSLAVAGAALSAIAADPPLPVAAPLPGAAAVSKPPEFPSSAVPTSAATSPPPAPLPQPVSAELNDGSKVEFDADGTVWVLNPAGGKTVAPDGILSLKDGTPFAVKDGKRVNE